VSWNEGSHSKLRGITELKPSELPVIFGGGHPGRVSLDLGGQVARVVPSSFMNTACWFTANKGGTDDGDLVP
jgi:hypothetical protein